MGWSVGGGCRGFRLGDSTTEPRFDWTDPPPYPPPARLRTPTPTPPVRAEIKGSRGGVGSQLRGSVHDARPAGGWIESCVARGGGGGPGEGQVTVLGCAHQLVVVAPAVDREVALGAPTNWWQLLQGARQGPVYKSSRVRPPIGGSCSGGARQVTAEPTVTQKRFKPPFWRPSIDGVLFAQVRTQVAELWRPSGP